MTEQICNNCIHWKKDCVDIGWCKMIALTLNYAPTQEIEHVEPLMCKSDFGCNLFELKPVGPFTVSAGECGNYSIRFYSCGHLEPCAECPVQTGCQFAVYPYLSGLSRQNVTGLVRWLNERWIERD